MSDSSNNGSGFPALPSLSSAFKAPVTQTVEAAKQAGLQQIDQRYVPLITQVHQKAAAAAAGRGQEVKQIIQAQKQQYAALTTAREKRDEIGKYPRFVADLLGMFDPAFDWEAWNAQARKAKEKISLLSNRLENQKQLAAIQDTFNRSTLYALQTAQQADQRRVLGNAAIAAAGNADQQAAQELALKQQQLDLSTQAGQRAAAQLKLNKQQAAQQATLFAEQQRQIDLAKRGDEIKKLPPDELRKITGEISGKPSIDTQALNITPSEAEDELTRKMGISNALFAATALAENDKRSAFTALTKTMTTSELDNLVEQTQQKGGGYIYAGPFKITPEQFNAGRAQTKLNDKARRALDVQTAVASTEYNAELLQMTAIINGVNTVSGLAVDPATPIAYQAAIVKSSALYEAGITQGEGGAIAVLRQAKKGLRQAVDDAITQSFPDDKTAQGYARTLINGGRPTETQVNTQLRSVLLDTNSIGVDNPLLTAAATAAQTVFTKLVTGATGALGADINPEGRINLTELFSKTKQKFPEFVAQTFNTPVPGDPRGRTVRQIWRGQRDADGYIVAYEALRKSGKVPEGAFNESTFYANRVFNALVLTEQLRAAYAQAVDVDPTFTSTENWGDLYLKQLQAAETMAVLAKRYEKPTLIEHAFGMKLFNGNPVATWPSTVRALVDTLAKRAETQQQQEQKDTQDKAKARAYGRTFSQPFSGLPVTRIPGQAQQ